ncbi:MAG: hypothetical protein WAM30_01875, partial [Candidatus Dormiibacterota bacterium]
MRRWRIIAAAVWGLVALLLVSACGGGAAPPSHHTHPMIPASPSPSHHTHPLIPVSPTPTPSPLPPPASPAGAVAPDPSQQISALGKATDTSVPQGYDDHVSFLVDNHGSAIGDVFVFLAVYASWTGQHSVAMGTSPQCIENESLGGFDCGPLAPG